MTTDIKQSTYTLEDKEIKRVNLDGDIVVRLLTNNLGAFVDVRKYYKGYPTKKGIRIYVNNYIKINDLLMDDIKKLSYSK